MSLLATYFVGSRDQADAMSRGELVDGLDVRDGPALLPTDIGDLQRRMLGRESWSLVSENDESWLVQLGTDFTSIVASATDSVSDDLADQFQLSAGEIDALEVMRPLARRAEAGSELAVYVLITL